MKALVLAGGRGTRLRPFTHSMAKQLLPVANRPILHFVIDQVTRAGINSIVVVISPETGDQIRDSLDENSWGANFEFVVQGQPLGLAHAVKVARPNLGDSPFMMYLGDILFGGSITDLLNDFQNTESDATVLLKRVEDPRLFGVAVLDDDGQIVRLVEKSREPVSNLALAGVYCFAPSIHEAIERTQPSQRGELEITDAIQNLLEHGGRVNGIETTDWWSDCGSKQDLLEANFLTLRDYGDQNLDGFIDGNSRITRSDGSVSVGVGARILNSEITGPVAIGENTLIEDSTIGPSVSIGNRTVVSASHITESIILDGVNIDGVQELRHSIIGHHAKLANRGAEPIEVSIGDGSELLI